MKKEVYFYCKIKKSKLSSDNVDRFSKQLTNVLLLFLNKFYDINLVEIGEHEDDFLTDKLTIKFSNLPSNKSLDIKIYSYYAVSNG